MKENGVVESKPRVRGRGKEKKTITQLLNSSLPTKSESNQGCFQTSEEEVAVSANKLEGEETRRNVEGNQKKRKIAPK